MSQNTAASKTAPASTEVFLLKDLARRSGHSIHTVKYYLKIGLIHEAGRSSETRFRYFNEQTLEQLFQIRRLQKTGMTLAEIKARLGSTE